MTHKHHKMDILHVFSYVGLVLHVPGLMAIFSIVVALIFNEEYSILPLIVTAAIAIGIGQLLYHICKREHQPSLWDSMAIAALSWLLCPLIAAIPFYWICSHRYLHGFQYETALDLMRPLNALFEAFSGFTGSGLTLVKKPSEFANTLLWWRSFTQWIGGVGLIVFILSVVEVSRNRYHLYYAESRTEVMGGSIRESSRAIWGIYVFYTICSILLFILTGMPVWQAINHGMTGISTGGFTVTDASFANYSYPIKIAAIIIMLAGAMSFVVHFLIVKKHKISVLWTSISHRFLIGMFVCGGMILSCIEWATLNRWNIIDSAFMWVSAMTTCGFSVQNLQTHVPMLKIFLIIAMIIGGVSGSTSGGIKIQRFLNLISGFVFRVKGVFEIESTRRLRSYFSKSQKGDNEPDIYYTNSEQVRKLFASGILFFLWMLTMLLAWLFVSFHMTHAKAFNAFFEVVSSMSNVGLTTNVITPDLSAGCLIVFTLIMWLGRVEIIPAIVLIMSIFRFFEENKTKSVSKRKR